MGTLGGHRGPGPHELNVFDVYRTVGAQYLTIYVQNHLFLRRKLRFFDLFDPAATQSKKKSNASLTIWSQ